jgi:ABC-2 type transport system permease protein
MKTSRILAIVLRNIFTFRRNFDRVVDAFYWPILDITIWGLTSAYITKFSANTANLVTLVVSGLTFWLLVNRSQYETNVALLEDIWSRNVTNIFVSPLKFSEWIIGVVIIGILKAFLSFVVALGIAFFLYKINFLSYGLFFVPFIPLLLMTGWWVSFFIVGCILRYGTKVQTFAWSVASLLIPFSGIYYPTESLPSWAQKISLVLPTTYVFKGVREVIFNHSLNSGDLFFAFVLNSLYLVVTIIFLKRSYDKLLDRGMLQLF